MFQAAFGYGVRTELVIMEGDPNSQRGGVTVIKYKEILEEYLPNIIEEGVIFIHDNVVLYIAKIIKEQLEEKGVKVMNQLKYSAVLNPIKNLQAILKKEIYRRFLNLLERPNS